jgi:hypothetical protein
MKMCRRSNTCCRLTKGYIRAIPIPHELTMSTMYEFATGYAR